jgi:Clostripain family
MSANTAAKPTPSEAKWTVMVFMGAAPFEGSADLHDAANADLAEMRSVAPDEDDDDFKIFVQVHGIGEPRRAIVTQNMPIEVEALERVPSAERQSAEGVALLKFIESALRARYDVRNDPRPHYTMLVLWGHAYDFAIGRETNLNGKIEALDFDELSQVLKQLQKQFAPNGKLDILGFDACDAATVEIACHVEPFAKYLLGSQIGIPIPGWPYDRIFDRLREPKGRIMGPSEFGSYVVRRFCESYNAATDVVSLTLVDLDRASELAVFWRFLSLTLLNAIVDPRSRDQIAYLFSDSRTAANKPYVDVADLCLNLVRRSGDPLIVEAATAMGNFLISPRPPLVGRSEVGKGRPFVVEQGRNAGGAVRLNGVSIYAPHVAPGGDLDAVRRLYENFALVKETETRWSELVHELARTT